MIGLSAVGNIEGQNAEGLLVPAPIPREKLIELLNASGAAPDRISHLCNHLDEVAQRYVIWAKNPVPKIRAVIKRRGPRFRGRAANWLSGQIENLWEELTGHPPTRSRNNGNYLVFAEKLCSLMNVNITTAQLDEAIRRRQMDERQHRN